MTEPVTRLMRIAALALCALAGTAAAQAPGRRAITPPAGWQQQPPKPDAPGVEAYYPPDAGAPAAGPRPAALYVTRAERKAAPDRRDAIASAELEEIFAAQHRQGANARTEASARRADDAARQLEAALTWRDASLGVVDASRVVVAADAQRVVSVTGECLLGTGASAELVKACEAALATLDPGIPAAARVPLAMTAELAPEPAPAAPARSAGSGAAPAPAPTPEPSGSIGPAPPSLGDASHIEAPARPGQAAPAADRRPIYLGVGLVALALLFWWNRRRRERFERVDGGGDRGGGGGDDEDLHAAADEPAPPAPPAQKEKDE